MMDQFFVSEVLGIRFLNLSHGPNDRWRFTRIKRLPALDTP
jgi:hypothetical protein